MAMDLVLLLPLLIFSVIVHEVSHGLVALKQGDNTALVSGRLTLNPLPHIDPIGSIILPVICIFSHLPVFGWARPVPINPNRFSNYRAGVIMVSLAGPLSNFLIAVGCVVTLHFFSRSEAFQGFSFMPRLLSQGVLLNLVLAVFNLVPVPPLDGSRIVSVILPHSMSIWYNSLEPYGAWIVMILIATGLLSRVMYPLVYFIYSFLLSSFGIF